MRSVAMYLTCLGLAAVTAILCGCPVTPTVTGPTARFETDVEGGYAPITIEFTDKSKPGASAITSRSWVIGRTEVSTESVFSYEFKYPGTYTVSLKVTTADGTDTVTKKNYVHILEAEAPTAEFTADVTEGDPPLTVQFTDASTPGTGTEIEYLWDFGDGETSDEQSPSHEFVEGRSYTVSLTVTTEHGKDRETKPDFIALTPTFPPEADFTATPTSGRDPLTVTFTDTSEPGSGETLTYSWNFGDGGTSTAQNPSHVYRTIGEFDVSLTVTSEYGSSTKERAALVSTYNDTRALGGSGADRGKALLETEEGVFLIAGETTSFGAGGLDGYLVAVGEDGNPAFTKTYGGALDDYLNAMAQSSEGSLFLAGGTTTEENGTDMYLVRTDSAGNRLWSKTYGGEGDENANAIVVTDDGGLVLAGTTDSIGAGANDFYLVRADGDGNALWSQTYGGASFELLYAAQVTSDGGIVLAGVTGSSGAGGSDAYVVKTDGAGVSDWARTFGGTQNEYVYSVIEVSTGGYLAVGSTTSAGAGGADAYVLRIDAAGNQVWAQNFGGAGQDRAQSVVELAEGGFLVGGYTDSSGAGLTDAFLLKLDADGNAVWEDGWLTYGGEGGDRANAVVETAAGGFAFAGETSSSGAGGLDVYFGRTDAEGALIGYAPEE